MTLTLMTLTDPGTGLLMWPAGLLVGLPTDRWIHNAPGRRQRTWGGLDKVDGDELQREEAAGQNTLHGGGGGVDGGHLKEAWGAHAEKGLVRSAPVQHGWGSATTTVCADISGG